MSPLEDLIPLGYEVSRPPEGQPIQQATAWRYSDGKQWFVNPGDDEEAIVARAKNDAAIGDKLDTMIQYFAGNYANWSSMSAAQKDAANRQAQRALSNLCRYARNDLSSEGA